MTTPQPAPTPEERDRIDAERRRLQVYFRLRPALAGVFLRSIARDVELVTGAHDVRASLMLPTSFRTRIVVYHYGMENSEDLYLELDTTSGCSGAAWKTRRPAFADLNTAPDEERWKMLKEQHALVAGSQQSMLSVPVFDYRSVRTQLSPEIIDELPLLAALSVDSSSLPAESGWIDENSGGPAAHVAELLQIWADLSSKLLT